MAGMSTCTPRTSLAALGVLAALLLGACSAHEDRTRDAAKEDASDESTSGEDSGSRMDAEVEAMEPEPDADAAENSQAVDAQADDAQTDSAQSDAQRSAEDGGAAAHDAGDAGVLADACIAGRRPPGAVNKVDLLLMVDNSGSMSQEQKKLARALPQLIRMLATGQRSGRPPLPGMMTDFTPVESLHVGVVTPDLGVNGAPSQNSCGDRSFLPTDRDPRSSTQRINKPVGDDGVLQVDTDVAAGGVFAPLDAGEAVVEVVPADPSCSNLTFASGARFVALDRSSDPEEAAHRVACIATRGRNGCGFEQQLEAVLKALTPADSAIKFTALSPDGHGGAAGSNQNFLRDDALLVVALFTDEEDCSIPDSSRAIFDPTVPAFSGGLNVRCGLPENQHGLFPVTRYLDGLRALKPPAFRERIMFLAATGIPMAPDPAALVRSGGAAFEALLARADMQFKVQRNQSGIDDEPVPVCTSPSGDGTAAPGRRFLEVAKGFGERALVASICEDQYDSLFQALLQKIELDLGGTPCL
jgi:hypothetical protein